jgi:hypothetical protein
MYRRFFQATRFSVICKKHFESEEKISMRMTVSLRIRLGYAVICPCTYIRSLAGLHNRLNDRCPREEDISIKNRIFYAGLLVPCRPSKVSFWLALSRRSAFPSFFRRRILRQRNSLQAARPSQHGAVCSFEISFLVGRFLPTLRYQIIRRF